MHWISVKDKLPDTEGCYMLFDGHEVFAGTFSICKDGRKWWGIQGCDGFCYGNFEREDLITHWTELPKPPKEGYI